MYADFESILKQLSDGNKYQEHIACSHAYQIVSNVLGIEFEPRLHGGVDVADHSLTLYKKISIDASCHSSKNMLI